MFYSNSCACVLTGDNFSTWVNLTDEFSYWLALGGLYFWVYVWGWGRALFFLTSVGWSPFSEDSCLFFCKTGHVYSTPSSKIFLALQFLGIASLQGGKEDLHEQFQGSCDSHFFFVRIFWFPESSLKEMLLLSLILTVRLSKLEFDQGSHVAPGRHSQRFFVTRSPN